MSLIFDLKKLGITKAFSNINNSTNNATNNSFKTPTTTNSVINGSNNQTNTSNNADPLILQAPKLSEIKFFDEDLGQTIANKQILNTILVVPSANREQTPRKRKTVRFPDDEKIIKDYSEPPKHGWIPGLHSTSDLLEAYLKSCQSHKTKTLAKLIPQLKALQDLECSNGEKVNVLNLKSERFDSKQMEALEEIFKRLSFKTIDFENAQFDDEDTGAILFDILDYYDTCERLILANVRSLGMFGWQSLSKYIRKSLCLELIDLRGQVFTELIYFTYIARSFRLSTSLRIIHLENSNIQGRLLLMLAASVKENKVITEIYLSDNKLQPSDGQTICNILRENKHLELLDLRNNNLQDMGLSHICSGLSGSKDGLKILNVSNNNVTANSVCYLAKALIHNRSLTCLNLSQNALANEALYELKEALIVNNQINTLILTRTKITDEGAIALAEYLAETQSLKRLDLRENEIRLGGLMALASSLKINRTVNRIDLDREPKKENNFKDSIETSRRLLQDINEFCMRNKREEAEREAEEREEEKRMDEKRRKVELDNEQKLNELLEELKDKVEEYINESYETNESNSSSSSEITLATTLSEANEQSSSIVSSSEDEEELLAKQDDVLLKKILNRNIHSNFINSPMTPHEKQNLRKICADNLNANNQLNDTLEKIALEQNEPIVLDDFLKNNNSKLDINDKSFVCSTPQKPKLVSSKHRKSLEMKFIENDVNNLLCQLIDQIVSSTNHSDSDQINTSQTDSSFIVEREPSDVLLGVQNVSNFLFNQNIISNANVENSAYMEDDDSDIEVLTVSGSQKNSVKSLLELAKQQDLLNKKSSGSFASDASMHDNPNIKIPAVLLNSIEENEIIGLETSLTTRDPNKNENDSSSITSSFDLASENGSMTDKSKIEDFVQIKSNKKGLVDYSLNTTEETTKSNESSETSLILLPSPVETIAEPSDTQINTKADATGSGTAQNIIQISPVFSSQSSSVEVNSLIDEQKPFFTSKLTNSQLSEELSTEIGL
jgi:protein phosphatase 1 regulatory subunit 37